MWELALADPHLIRLKDWLAHTDGEKHYSREELERSYLEEPWMCDLDVIYVVDPNYWRVPFVQIWSNKEEPHATCGFAQLETSGQKVYIIVYLISFVPFADILRFWTDLIISGCFQHFDTQYVLKIYYFGLMLMFWKPLSNFADLPHI